MHQQHRSKNKTSKPKTKKEKHQKNHQKPILQNPSKGLQGGGCVRF